MDTAASPMNSLCSSVDILKNMHPDTLTVHAAADALRVAMDRIEEIIYTIHPTLISDYRRNEIIDYLKTLVENSFEGVEVFPVGSMPLKTYLPHGDIDLTIVSCHHHHTEDALVTKLYNLLSDEETMNSVYHVTDVEIIPAMVKIVKCRVENICVDISINQVAGLRVTDFLEEVNKFIGQDHIFKRSIILVKSWCLYESRILGSSSSLICTYGLDVMVLHLFNLYHHLLKSPLAVLYKFLEYYNMFDWEKYGVAINGQLLLSFLPYVIVELPADSNAEALLLTDEFCTSSRESSTVINPTISHIQKRFLNILDPLNDENNLGRSVNEANFKRIKGAFAHGFDQLNRALTQSKESMTKSIDHFFRTTLQVLNNDASRRSLLPSVIDNIRVTTGFNKYSVARLLETITEEDYSDIDDDNLNRPLLSNENLTPGLVYDQKTSILSNTEFNQAALLDDGESNSTRMKNSEHVTIVDRKPDSSENQTDFPNVVVLAPTLDSDEGTSCSSTHLTDPHLLINSSDTGDAFPELQGGAINQL